MPTGISVLTSMECLWRDAFTIVKITLAVKMHVLLSSSVALRIAPVRLVKFCFILCNLYINLLSPNIWSFAKLRLI